MALDKRRHAYRDDLADISLRGRVDASQFTSGELYTVSSSIAPVRRSPRPSASLDTEFLYGEGVLVFEHRDGWAWIQGKQDGYVGYTPFSNLKKKASEETSSLHRISALRTLLLPEPDLKTPPLDILHHGSCISINHTAEHGDYSELESGGFIFSNHIRPVDEIENDPVTVALRYLNAPYIWGGRSSLGLDCSALIQLSWQACGIDCPRDTDMQFAEFGTPIPYDGNEAILQRGDLVFWKGHVGIWINPNCFLHANASDMMVSFASLAWTAERIASKGEGSIIGVRRPPLPTATVQH